MHARVRKLFVGLVVFLVICASASRAERLDDSFYKGKTIRIVAGFGGAFDVASRLLARHMPRYILGNPSMVVQQILGAGSLIAANTVYAMQPGDGLTIVTFHFGLIGLAAIGDPAVRFDARGWIWLGDFIRPGPRVAWIRSELGIHSLDEWRKSKKPLAFATTGPGTGGHDTAEFLRFIDLPVRVVSGYKTLPEMVAALERKEVDGIVVNSDGLEIGFPHMIHGNVLRPILVFHTDPAHRGAPGLATLAAVNLAPEERRVADFLVLRDELIRVFALPPGTPVERARMLQQAFVRALNDPHLLEEAKRLRVEVSPVLPETVAALVNRLGQTSRDTADLYLRISRSQF